MFYIDEFWQYVKKKELSLGDDAIGKPSKQILAIFCGKRTKKSARSIWQLIKGLNPKYIFTDQLQSYQGVLPKIKHIIGKHIHKPLKTLTLHFVIIYADLNEK